MGFFYNGNATLINHLQYFCVLYLVLLLAGCNASKSYTDPVAVMLDSSQPRFARLKAMAQLEDVVDNDMGPYQKGLHVLAWNDGHPLEMRKRAVQRLVEIDEKAFVEASKDLIAVVDQWPMIEYLFELAESKNWEDYTIVAAHSWSRKSTLYSDQQRPERKFIEVMHPDLDVVDVLAKIYTGQYEGASERHQIAAWLVLSRLLTHDELLQINEQYELKSVVARDIQYLSKWLAKLPDTREGILWTMYLLSEESGIGQDEFELLDGAGECLDSMQVRHLPVVLHCLVGKENIGKDFGSEIEDYLALQKTYPRIDHAHMLAESYAKQNGELTKSDRLVISQIVKAVQLSTVKRELFRQADLDKNDKTTEYGGVLKFDGDGYEAKLFKPDIKAHDGKFYSTNSLIKSMYTGLSHYHFHVQDYENGEFAGPGGGDLKFADRLGTHALVFTFIDKNTLNVDYLQPGGIVIDLGTISRF